MIIAITLFVATGLTGRDYTEALTWCTRGAEQDESNSQTLLAEMYYFGKGTQQDYSIAAKWYEAAAAQDHIHAQLMLYFI